MSDMQTHCITTTMFSLQSIETGTTSSGANATKGHIEEVSLCTLFLLEAAKKADEEFGLPQRSTRHTTRDSAADIKKVALHLLENNVTQPQIGRSGVQFHDSTEDGLSKMTPAWLKRVLTTAPDAEDTTASERQPLEESAANYELF